METERLLIEEINDHDFPELQIIYNGPQNMKYILNGKNDWTLEELKEKWDAEKYDPLTQIGFLLVKLKSNRKIIGECALMKTTEPIQDKLEMAYMSDEPYWRSGYGKEICEALMHFAFQKIGTNYLTAGVQKDNVGSAKLLEHKGFQLEDEEGISKSGVAFKVYKMTKAQYLNPSFTIN